MASGRLENNRQLLLSQGIVIGSLFDKDARGSEDTFIQFGVFGNNAPEPHNPAVDEKVAEAFRTGKVTFN